MNNCSYMLVLCFGVVLSTRLAMAIGGSEMELLTTKLNYLQDKQQEVEQTLLAAMESMEQRLQEKLTKHEKNISEKLEMMNTQFVSQMHAMENSLKKSVRTSKENTRTKLEDVTNQLIYRIDNMQLQLWNETKTIQEKTQTELKLVEENKKTLDILTDSVRNISIQSKFNTQLLHMMRPVSSCRQALNVSGKYMIKTGINTEPFEVFCEQNKTEGGWTVIQHRFNGSVDFYRNWTEYRNGFGNLYGEFWLGLEYLHQITKNRPHELLVELKDFHGNYGYAKYDGFEIGDESELYVLKKLGTYSGTAGDSMKYHKDEKFSTFDRDNDESNSINCAERWHGAWWYYQCQVSNLNGLYQNTTGDASAMVWLHLKSDKRGLSYSRMMIRDIIN